jgi:hypothetical protein
MNTTSGHDIAENIYVACLFVPLALIYTYLLVFISQITSLLEAHDWFREINEILGYGMGIIILLGVQIAAKFSKNDFIAGPLEQLNSYTFFFLGLFLGGLRLALLFTVLHEALLQFGLPLLVNSISRNEKVKAQSIGISNRAFITYQYMFAPIESIATMIIAYWILSPLMPIDTLFSRSIIEQLKYSTYFIATWTALGSIAHMYYYRTSLQIGPANFSTMAFLLATVINLSFERASWLWYGAFISIGWIMIITFIMISIKTAREIRNSTSEVKYIKWR